MFRVLLQSGFILTIFYIVKCDDNVLEEGNNIMMGVNTVHNKQIDEINKDTIVTRHMNSLQITKRGKTANVAQDKPGWTYRSFPEEIKDHARDFKRNMTECLKEVEASDNRPVKRLSPNKESPVHGECLIACVLKRNGVIKHGKVSKENLLILVGKFYGKNVKLIKKLENNLDRCINASVRSKNDCEIAARLNECTNDIMVINKNKFTVKY